MEEIIFISKEYFPVSNGTTACLENILPLFAKHYKIKLFAAQTEDSYFAGEKDGVRIFRYKCWSDRVVLKKQRLLKKIKLLNCKDAMKNIMVLFVKMIFYPFQFHSNLWGYMQPEGFAKNIVKRIQEEGRFESVKIIMAVGGPFENAIAAAELKKSNQNLKLVYIFFDLFAYNPVSMKNDQSSKDLEYRLKCEEEWMQLADDVFCAIETKNTIMNSELNKYANKYHFLYIPSLKIYFDELKSSNMEDEKDIVIVYAGTFYEDIRNPLYMLRLFQNVIKGSSNIKLHILGFGCEDMINGFREQIGKNLIVHGQMDKHYTNNKLMEADFLLNLGNNTGTQLPSKIMEYIGMRKPIIHISSIEQDTCEKYLKKYPLKCILNEQKDSIEVASKKIKCFINQNYKKQCTAEEIEHLYHEFVPQHFVNEVLKTFM